MVRFSLCAAFGCAALGCVVALPACSPARPGAAVVRARGAGESRRGGFHERIRQEVETGTRLWRRSCPRSETHGLCVAVKYRPGKIGEPAGDEKRIRYLDRGRTLVRRAREHFHKALEIWKVGPADGASSPEDELKSRTAALEWVAAARFMLVDMDFESYLKADSPRELGLELKDPSASRKAMVKLRQWLRKKTDSATRLRVRYEDVVKVRSGRWAVAVLARIGSIFKHFAEQMADFPVPAFLTTRPVKDAFIVQMDSFIQPLEAKAAEVFGLCLKMAFRHRTADEWSRFCRAEKDSLGVVVRMSRRIILRVVRKHASELDRCYRTFGLAANPRLAGHVTVRFEIPESGGVRNATIERSSLNHPETERCILRNIRTWRFPGHRSRTAVVTYPFRFTPGVTVAGQPPP